MTTQQSEGALLNEKPLQTTLLPGKDGLNGSLEVNGHNSPPPESEPETAPKPHEQTPHTADLERKENQDAFSTNKALVGEVKNEHRTDSKADSEQDTATARTETEMEGAGGPADTNMPDAPINPALEEQSSKQAAPESQAQPEPKTRSEDRPALAIDTADTPAVSPMDTTPQRPAGQASPPDEKRDVVMVDAQGQAEPPIVADGSESTQETALSDVAPVTPVGDTINSAAGPLANTPGAPAGTPPGPATADTSMSDTAQPSAKVSRERDIDSEDEPVAKRTKVGHTGDQVEVKTNAAQDRMDVDQQADARSPWLYRENGEPKPLNDDSLDDTPLTEWQNKQIRQVLAGVKKTKAGHNFRLPVEHLWPALWAEYSARVSNPIDISLMEKRLRGEMEAYATLGDFKRDLDLLVANSVTFNGELHEVTNSARICREAILSRMGGYSAAEPAKPERKESVKQHTTRHVEPRTAVPAAAQAAPRRPSKGAASSPSQKPAVESPAFAIPANNNGVPLIRRDSSKPDSRAKRPVKPAHPKDLVYDTKRKKKLPLELRFCDDVLTELRKAKHYDINAAFMQPVDPVALNIPSYHKVIKKPMDLQTMANKLGSGEYTTAKEFEKDFDLIIKNCRTFNGEDHIVYEQALKLQDLYRAEMSKKDEWMAKHAPAAQTAASHLKDDSEDDDGDSEAEPEQDEERKALQHRIATIQKRLEEEQKKINEMVLSANTELADVEITQSVVNMLQVQLIQERNKLAGLPAKKAGKPKPKSKKAGSGAAISGKKASVAGAGGATGGTTKKVVNKRPAPKRKIGQLEKEMIVETLGELNTPYLEKAIELIKKDTGAGENDSGELELDIELLSEEVLVKLYDIVIKAFPNLRAEKERALAPPSADPPAAKPKSTGKSKKNKPMSKLEQERRIQQLNELRAQAGRQASGSQEPMESIEGNGNDAVTQPEHESEDEVSSEEE
ncbi:Bromodomain-containing factor 1 [Madurella mycetomatis]|uniref:Bromodomain-containing factor 1 n=1 Tax=Madurella mycetomatis TaxID=100816 RepID=A0A175WID9_9PEZI|nr:Bromodomain-containing factor 1 [Madurella mycetomatis]